MPQGLAPANLSFEVANLGELNMKNRDFLLYVGFILTTGLSLMLSILLFTSVADSRLSWMILMGIALALELGKIVDKRP